MDLDLTRLLLLWLSLGQMKSCVSMHCSHGAVRLVNDQEIYEGRVEICLHGTWKTVCDDYWGIFEAKVVCTQLGYQHKSARALAFATFGQGTGSIVEVVSCYGNETNLISCTLYDVDDGYCTHAEDAGVQCSHCPINGDVRLQGTIYPYRGWVEVCVNGTWSTVCNGYYNWDSVDASVVCKQLGYSRHGARAEVFFGCHGFILHRFLSDVRCSGNEQRLIDCPYVISPQLHCFWREAAVKCQPSLRCQEGELRLINGGSVSEGRVEICLNETWGTVCSNNWDQLDSIVVCKQLGYSDKGAELKLDFQRGGGPIHLNNVQCIGNESNLYGCQHHIYITTVSCIHVVGVSCSFDVPSVPLNLQTNIYYESNNCTLTWQAPKMTEQHGLPLYYIINCTTEDDYTIIYANDTDQNLEVLSYTFYSCCVSGVNEVGIGSPACQTFITYESAPNTPPTTIEVHPFNATSVFLSWRPPLVKHRNGIIREYDIEVVELNTTTKFMYTTQDPYLLINNLDPDKVYQCRIAAITIEKGPYSELVMITKNDYSDSDSEQSSVDTCTFTEMVLVISITSGVLLLLLFSSSILFVIVCFCSKVCRSSKENTRYEMVDITGTNSGNISRPATVTQEQCSQPPMSPPAQLSNDRTTETSFGYKEGHSTPVCTNATQPAKRENTYQPLIPLRVHQKSISTEYQSLRQLPKEKSHDLPPPIPPKPRCD